MIFWKNLDLQSFRYTPEWKILQKIFWRAPRARTFLGPQSQVKSFKISLFFCRTKNVCHMCANHVIFFETIVWYPKSEFLQYYYHIWPLKWFMSIMNLPRWWKSCFFRLYIYLGIDQWVFELKRRLICQKCSISLKEFIWNTYIVT